VIGAVTLELGGIKTSMVLHPWATLTFMRATPRIEVR
jgi:hypothetical protein